MSEYDLEKWAFDNEDKVLAKAELWGELIALKETDKTYIVTALDESGCTLMSNVPKGWLRNKGEDKGEEE